MLPTAEPSGLSQQAFLGRAYPSAEQAEALHGWMGASRYTYNALLHLLEYNYLYCSSQWDRLAALRERPDLMCLYPLVEQATYTDETEGKRYTVSANLSFLSYLITCLKSHPEKTWLREVPRDVLTYTAKSLISAFQGFYRLVKQKRHIGPDGLIGFPRYKSKRSKQSIRLQAKEAPLASYPGRRKKHEILLPTPRALEVKLLHRLLPLKVRGLKQLHGRHLTVTLTYLPNGTYSVSVLTELPHPRQRLSGNGVIAIDLSAQKRTLGYCYDGVHSFMLSDIEPVPPTVPALERRIRHLQALLARKTKGGCAWRRLKHRIAHVHHRLAAVYEGYYHRVSNWLIGRYSLIILEDLDVTGLLKEAYSDLAKLIQDSRFRLFRELLTYKASQGTLSYLGIADRYYPSTQLCSSCGSKPAQKLPLAVKAWTCEACGASHHRDENAAKNLYLLAGTPLSWPVNSALVRLEAYRP